MIEFLGIGIRHLDGDGWLVREGTARLDPGQLVVLSGADSATRLAVLDVIGGRRIPAEGRAWIHHIPLMRETAARIRRFGGEARLDDAVHGHGSVLWSVMAASTGARLIGRLLPLPGRQAREKAAAALAAVGLGDRVHEPVARLSRLDRHRLVIAQAVAGKPPHLVIRELDGTVPRHDVEPLLTLLRSLTRNDRRLVVVTLAEPTVAARLADRCLHVAGVGFVDGGPPTPQGPQGLDRRLVVVRT